MTGARLFFVSVTVLAVLAGCSAGGPVREHLDRTTGTTWSTAAAPAAFARTDPRFSRAERDYLYIGPVETNVRGLHEYYLWIGVATTLDRGFLAPERAAPARLTFVIDGEPVDLQLGSWSQVVDDARRIDPYDTPVRPTLELGARVTRDLLARLDAAAPEFVVVATESDEAEQYFAWRTWPDWSGISAADRAR